MTVGVPPGQIEQIHTGEGNEEATKQGQGVDYIAGVEALEENEGGTKRGCSEGDVI